MHGRQQTHQGRGTKTPQVFFLLLTSLLLKPRTLWVLHPG